MAAIPPHLRRGSERTATKRTHGGVKAFVAFEFNGRSSDEVSVAQGQKVLVLSHPEEHWVQVQVEKEGGPVTGLVPHCFVRISSDVVGSDGGGVAKGAPVKREWKPEPVKVDGAVKEEEEEEKAPPTSRARVLWTFKSRRADELYVRRSEIVTVVGRPEDNWVRVSRGFAGDSGLVPATYLALIEEGGEEDEIGCLSCLRGKAIGRKEAKPSSSWGSGGSEPSAAAAVDSGESKVESAAMAPPAPRAPKVGERAIALWAFGGDMHDDNLKVRAGETVTVVRIEEEGWLWVRNGGGKEGAVPANFLEAQVPSVVYPGDMIEPPHASSAPSSSAPGAGPADVSVSIAPSSSPAPLSAPAPSSSPAPAPAPAPVPSSTASPPALASAPAPAPAPSSARTGAASSGAVVISVPLDGSETPTSPAADDASTVYDAIPAGEVGKVLWKFAGSNADELSVEPGDVVTVVDHPEEAWVEVSCRDGRVGLIPVNHIQFS